MRTKPPIRDVIHELGSHQRHTTRELAKHEQNLYGVFFDLTLAEDAAFIDIPVIPQYGRYLRVSAHARSDVLDSLYFAELAVQVNGVSTEFYDWFFYGFSYYDYSGYGTWATGGASRAAMALGDIPGATAADGFFSRTTFECKGYALDDGKRKHWQAHTFYPHGYQAVITPAGAYAMNGEGEEGGGVSQADPVTSLRVFTWNSGAYSGSSDQLLAGTRVVARILA